MPDAAAALRALRLVDLTDLGDATTPEAIDRLCGRALGPFGFTAAVCVWPRFVTQAVNRLRGSGVRVATVVNFPAGGTDVAATLAETRTALGDGADEIDLVLPYRSFLAGDVEAAVAVLDAVRAAVAPPSLLKVILETGSLPNRAAIHAASRLAIDHGADFIKTSTGKTAVSALPDAVEAMLEEIRATPRTVGLKPSGGIRTLDDAQRYLDLADRIMGPDWATQRTFRFGASGLLDALEADIAGMSHDSGDATY